MVAREGAKHKPRTFHCFRVSRRDLTYWFETLREVQELNGSRFRRDDGHAYLPAFPCFRVAHRAMKRCRSNLLIRFGQCTCKTCMSGFGRTAPAQFDGEFIVLHEWRSGKGFRPVAAAGCAVVFSCRLARFSIPLRRSLHADPYRPGNGRVRSTDN